MQQDIEKDINRQNSSLKINELEVTHKNPLISLDKKNIFLLSLTIILLLCLLGAVVINFQKSQTSESQMLTKINTLTRKIDQTLKSYQELQQFKTELGKELSKTAETVLKLQVKSDLISNGISELKEELARQATTNAKRIPSKKRHQKKK